MQNAVVDMKPKEASNTSDESANDAVSDTKIERMKAKMILNEYRARDAEARCRIVEAEVKIIRIRKDIENEAD